MGMVRRTRDGNQRLCQAARYTVNLLLAICFPIGLAPATAAEPVPVDFATAVKICREYLASDDDDERKTKLSQLAGYSGFIEPVIQALRTQSYPSVKPGYYEEEQFRSEERRKKYPKDLL